MERTLFLVQRLQVYSCNRLGSDRISIVATLSAGTVGFVIHKLNGPRAHRLWASGRPP